MNELRDALRKIMDEYPGARSRPLKGDLLADFIRNEWPKVIRTKANLDESRYLIKGSAGQGEWATVPWLAILDRRVTTCATEGVRLGYLLANGGERFYLALLQGVARIKGNSRNPTEAMATLRTNAHKIASEIAARGFFSDRRMALNDKGQWGSLYELGTIYYKRYGKAELPDEMVLTRDLKTALEIYSEYESKRWLPR